MTGEERIVGQVARVLNSREIAINRGSQHGVQTGMRFAVLARDEEEIEDPETGEVLGTVKRPKVKVEVVRVEDRFSVARTYEARRVNVGGTGALTGFARLFEPPKWETRFRTLRTDEATWEDLEEWQSFVKTGDSVEQLKTPDEDEPTA